jgi:general secretion pathway protein D
MYWRFKQLRMLLIVMMIFLSQITIPLPAQKKSSAPEKKRSITLNFRDVELSEFLNAMSGILGKNIIYDDRIKGKITVFPARTVPSEDIYEVFLDILNYKGFAVIEGEHLLKIVPLEEARKKNSAVIVR